MTYPRLIETGVVNGIGLINGSEGTYTNEAVLADVSVLGGKVGIVLGDGFTYSMQFPGLGFPTRPMNDGVGNLPHYPVSISSGTTITVLECEGDALVALGIATVVSGPIP